MIRLLFFSLFSFSLLPVFSQDSAEWAILLNKKKIFSAKEENDQKNIISVKLSDLKPGKNFTLFYLQVNTANKNQWIRTIGVYTTEDNELIRKNTSSITLPYKQIKKMLLENKTIRIYTWSLPKDPKEAARVRVRRVHLCTIVLK
jgi:hypothetical protein